MSRSKRYLENAGKVDIDKLYNLEDALDLIESSTKVKFDQTIDLSIKRKETFHTWSQEFQNIVLR